MHSLSKMTHYMKHFGKAKNFSGQVGERILKSIAKDHSTKTQRRRGGGPVPTICNDSAASFEAASTLWSGGSTSPETATSVVRILASIPSWTWSVLLRS
jgi:hypothetical protein